MITLRKSNERGHANHGWLDSHHTFSFAEYYDPRHMNFGPLRVINEDRIEGGMGFGTHPHRDMEIISYVIDGALEHQDSMGNKTVIRPGEVQRMSAGTGVAHSEYNHHKDKKAHFLQIWIMPELRGIKPGYGQKDFSAELDSKNLVLVASKSGRDGSISINQDADLYISRLKSASTLEHPLAEGRGAWIQLIKGDIEVNGQRLSIGDGAAVTGEKLLKIKSEGAAEFLIFDLTQVLN